MPEDEYIWLPRSSILTFEEIDRLVRVFARLGVTKLRLTGGEPLLRHDLATLVEMLRRHTPIRDLALTTNGVLLARHAPTLRAAGLDRVTVSLDTLRPDRFATFAGRARHAEVLDGITAARAAGFSGIKLNAVIVRGFNDDEVGDLIAFARDRECEVRFIEYMDVGGATRWSLDDVVSRAELLDTIARRFGPVRELERTGKARAPAERFRLPDGTTFGVIASTTAPFCSTCDRSRITADGVWFLCLYAEQGVDLKEALRRGASDDELERLIREGWAQRTDRGAEERIAVAGRGPLYQVEGLRRDPHREMHTRGG
jgi:cyclic pyranopterin phosphate synthase